MVQRILIHPGFHKTGTSTIQQFLWVNREALLPHVAVLQLRHLKEPARMCMSFARSRNPLLLADLATELDGVLAENGLAATDSRDILVSGEAISGHCPGWPGVDDYTTAPYTVSVVAGFFAERFPGAEVLVVFTMREAEAWLNSAWRHHLAGQKLSEDYPAWSERMRPASDLMAVVVEAAEVLAPVQAFTIPIEEAAEHPLGPGGSLLELLSLPEEVRAGLEPIAHANTGPSPELAAELLRLNRSRLPKDGLERRKAALLKEAGVGGWVKRKTEG